MNEAIIKDEVMEETHNFTFKNGEIVEVKQEEIEQKPEYLLEKDIKKKQIDFLETNDSDEFFDDVEPKPKENYCEVEKMSTEVNKLKCEICQKTMPKNLLKWIESEENKIVLAEMFKIEGSLKIRTPMSVLIISRQLSMIMTAN
ncbi:hypothetical protein B9Z55_021164 [Caenorhabditis nigoni]|uniref:Uncharacterized protein n=1 Tax=Caenorhabditis nigoni TaxID=1611254 RepID=A0A2G5TRM5_9PELO|nr:hypothetical protein B9Z55_021164 [Caenorhabditis nigoni]